MMLADVYLQLNEVPMYKKGDLNSEENHLSL